jgi:hypothetical protein
LALLVVALPAAAQEESPESSTEEECLPGELCGPTEGEDPFGESGQPVVDPPGRHVRSLITIGLIISFLGAYLISALTGRNPLKLARRLRRSG